MIDRRQFVGLGAWAAGAAATGVWSGAFAQGASAPAEGATVETTAGKIRGAKLGKVQAFKGVPYGASTAPPNRFMPPQKPQPWTGVRDTMRLGNRSPQLLTDFHGFVPPEVEAMDRNETLSEDCLMLNVWTPAVGAGKRPVMVWLHGGGYTSGSGGFICYDGAELAGKHDVVVVTVNHRLSVFGYLYLAGLGSQKYASASNVGQLDIVAALEWVRDNIGAFGGDASNVTVFGQSGGGGKVSTLLAMPSAKGLFHRAIVQSGASIRGLTPDAGTKTAEEFLSRLSLTPKDVDKLQTFSMEQILATSDTLQNKRPPLNTAPLVDGHSLPVHPFDPSAPTQSADIPLLIGTTETEVTFFPGTQIDPIDDADLRKRVKGMVRKASDAQVEQLIAAYRSGRPKDSNTDLFLIMSSDGGFRSGVLTEADRKAQQKAAVYQYYFTWRSPVREGKLRSYHTLEIPFVFDNVDNCQSMTGNGKDRYPLADRMAKAWVAFARTGNPNHAGLPKWGAFDTTKRTTMVFDKECKVVNDPHGEEQKLLRSLQSL